MGADGRSHGFGWFTIRRAAPSSRLSVQTAGGGEVENVAQRTAWLDVTERLNEALGTYALRIPRDLKGLLAPGGTR